MSSYRATFKKRHAFLPVIHVEDEEQTIRNTKIAIEGGADGVFLINHRMTWRKLLTVYESVRRKMPATWIGLNCLDLGQSAVQFVPSTTPGLWVDSAGVTDKGNTRARDFARSRLASAWRGIYFGGVAFKYQPLVSDIAATALSAKEYVDVITTSGDQTGKPPSVEKIITMRRAIGDHPLAIASGMTPDNIGNYLTADCFLVATGISGSFHDLDIKKVKRFSDKLGK
jgi:uncharacterized protein